MFYEEDDAPSTQQQELVKEDAAVEEVVGAHKEETRDVEEPSPTSTTSSNAAEPTQESEHTDINTHERRYPQRERKAPKPDGYWYEEEEAAKQQKMAPHESNMAYAMMGVLMDGEPRTLEEALSRPDQVEWRKAAEKEYKSLLDNETWTLVPRNEVPSDRKVIEGKWVLTTKRNVDGSILRHKGRWVAKVYFQREGVDYIETFDSVPR